MFRQQASIIVGKKAVKAEELLQATKKLKELQASCTTQHDLLPKVSFNSSFKAFYVKVVKRRWI